MIGAATARATPASDGPHRTMLITLASVAAGLIAAIVLVIGPAYGGTEAVVTGWVMVAFGAGWAMLGVLSARFTSAPQRWALAPAAFLGGTGLALILLRPGVAAMDLLSWIWPPALLAVALWALVAMRRSLRGRSRWLVTLVLAVLVLAAVGGASETIVDAVRGANATASGSLIDIGGRRLYLECAGTGSPTVVLQAGLGDTSQAWARVARSISTTTRVCSYDRAGHGLSDPAGEQDGSAVAGDLDALLRAAGIEGPYVLAGHSTGGPYARVFAARFPDRVAGMVFIDAQPPTAFTTLPDFPGQYRFIRLGTAVLPSLARLGAGWLAQSTPRAATATRDEFAMLPATLLEAAQLTTLGNRPVVVVTKTTENQAGWTASQSEYVGLSTNVSQRTPPGSTHYSLIEDPEDSMASTQAILDVVEAVRTAGAVPSR